MQLSVSGSGMEHFIPILSLSMVRLNYYQSIDVLLQVFKTCQQG